MKRITGSLLTILVFLCGVAVLGNAQERILRMPGNGSAVSQELPKPDPAKAFSYHPHPFAGYSTGQIEKLIVEPAVTGLPLWTYNVVAAQDGKPYSGMMVGRSPFLRGKIPMAVPTMVIPIKFEFLDGNGNVAYTFDPDAADPCAGGNTTTNLVLNSPILNNSAYTMNGVNVGNTQYEDAFQRANFWTLINGANYHLTLTPAKQPTLTITVGSGGWAVGSGSCSTLGAIEINAWDAFVQSTLLAFVGAQPNGLPLFFNHNVVWYITNTSNCCVLGYHNATAASPPQTYSLSDFESSGAFPSTFNDTVVMSHEVGEWMDDPLVSNPTPPWGNIGQVGGCQNNLEVGDPLTPTNFGSVFLNGFTYHLQELVFYSWFYGGASLGAGGKYSNNGTFHGDAKICPPGGTN